MPNEILFYILVFYEWHVTFRENINFSDKEFSIIYT